jgi:hypothetical protein
MVMPMSEMPMSEVAMAEVPMPMMVMPMVPMICPDVAANVSENCSGGNQAGQQ